MAGRGLAAAGGQGLARELRADDMARQPPLGAPYWWDAAPPEDARVDLPARVDVAIVGSGFAGLSAALEAARAGATTLVLDAGPLGGGASSRSGGMVSSGQKLVLTEALKGLPVARQVAALEDSKATFEFLKDLVAREGLDADLQLRGRFFGAFAPAHLETLRRNAETLHRRTGVTIRVLSREEQHEEVGSSYFHGGFVVEEYGGLHPAKLNRALREAARRAGATLASHARVLSTARDGAGHVLRTERGEVRARHVLFATNGYTGNLTPWLQRRVIPIGSYMIATEALPEGLMDRLIPKNRIVSDTRKVVFYYRASPDRQRILFGGRVSHQETDPRVSGPKLHADMAAIFPELATVRISHSWCGFVAYTFDELMHLGKHDGLHFAMGYCGAGVGTSSYFGMRIGQQVLGLKEGQTALDGLAFQTRPLYSGNPWFLAPSVAYYRLRDRLPI